MNVYQNDVFSTVNHKIDYVWNMDVYQDGLFSILNHKVLAMFKFVSIPNKLYILAIIIFYKSIYLLFVFCLG